MTNKQDPKIIIAFDFDTERKVFDLLEKIEPGRARIKVGKELFTRFGPQMVRKIMSQGFEVFLDLKFHDIPNTVAKACLAAADLGVWMVNCHALGGENMLTTASEAVKKASGHQPHLIAVTLLTSHDEHSLKSLGMAEALPEMVLRLAKLTLNAGFDGIVCSPQDLKALKVGLSRDFISVTPGIRPTFAQKNDQVRTMSPKDAINEGASYLVIGRPITEAENPMVALEKIEIELGQSLF